MKDDSLSIRGIDRPTWQRFKAKCAILGLSAGDRMNWLIADDLEREPCLEDVEKVISLRKLLTSRSSCALLK